MNGEVHIPGGYILLSRKLLRSGIMEKPPLYIKLWIWVLLTASHSDHSSLKRGQLFTSLERMRDAMKYRVGAVWRRPTKKEIRTACDFLTTGTMMGTTKGTHGMLITVLNYDYYQNPTNYEGHTEGHSDGNDKGTIKTRRETRNKKPPEDFALLIAEAKTRYAHPELIEQAIKAFASTRKSGKVADSVVLDQFKKWSRYTAEQVETGIQVYIDKDYPAQGKGEAYLLGIIRNHKAMPQIQPSNTGTGSPLLDRYYAGVAN